MRAQWGIMGQTEVFEMKKSILFVCHGNICRSTMAEFVMKDLVKKAGREKEFEIASAATSREEIGNDIHYGTKNVLREKGIPFESRRAVQMTQNDYRYYDLIKWEPHTRDFSRELGDQASQRL